MELNNDRIQDNEIGSDSDLNPISQKLSRKVNTADIVADGLRAAIIDGRFKPGARIRESRIAGELGLGQPTVREALVGLEHEGLIVRYPNRGCRVTALSRAQMDQIFRVRLELEPLCAQLAVESWADWKAEKLSEALEALKTAANLRNPQAYYASDLVFHTTLWSLAENPYLERALTQIVIPLFIAVMVRLPKSETFDFRGNAAEHEKIAAAVFAGANPREARRSVKQILKKFWQEGRRFTATASPEEAE